MLKQRREGLLRVGLQGKTVLVTGANGFVGSRIAQYLAGRGARVRGLVRRTEPLPELEGAGVELARGDIMDAAAMGAAVAGADAVVHCAAYVGPDTTESVRINSQGTRHLLEAAAAAGCQRFVHISTIAVYDHGGQAKVAEETPFVTAGTAYDLGKVAAEREVWRAAERGLPVVVLRPPAILGAHPNSMWAVRIARLIKAGQFRLVEGGENPFGYVHVENLAHAVELTITRPEAVGQAYNVVDGHTTWRAFTDLFRGIVGSGPLESVPFAQARNAFAWRGELSGEKLARELGYTPRRTFAEAMMETERFLKEHPELI